jgi:hypothetical protein
MSEENWQSKFRILKDWTIVKQKDDEYTGQVHCDWKARKAVICPWGSGEEADDYELHEILHICMGEIMYNRKPRREAEELFVQDLCTLIDIKGDKYNV